MTDLQKAAQMALDALEMVTTKMLECRDELAEYGGRPKSTGHKQRLWDSSHDVYVDSAMPAAEALRAALSRPEQEPVADGIQVIEHVRNVQYKIKSRYHIENGTELYTSPQQREWQGLTDDERKEIFESMPGGMQGFLRTWGWLLFSKALEQKLKEKNVCS